MNHKLEDLLNAVKLGEFINEKKAEKDKKNEVLCLVAIIAGIAAIIGVAYAIYKYMTPNYLDDFEDDFDDDYEEEFEDDLNDESESPSEEDFDEV